jgi:RimJ/RimL family protein N-acetyltransferase
MLKLKEVYLYVNVNNIPAIRAYEKSGFVKLRKTNDDFEMIVKNERFQ